MCNHHFLVRDFLFILYPEQINSLSQVRKIEFQFESVILRNDPLYPPELGSTKVIEAYIYHTHCRIELNIHFIPDRVGVHIHTQLTGIEVKLDLLPVGVV